MKHKIVSPAVAGRLFYGAHIQKQATQLIKIMDLEELQAYRGWELFTMFASADSSTVVYNFG